MKKERKIALRKIELTAKNVSRYESSKRFRTFFLLLLLGGENDRCDKQQDRDELHDLDDDTDREREEGESRPSVPLKRKGKKGSSCTLIKTGWVRFSYRHFIAVHGAGSCRPHQTFIVSHLLNHQSPKNRSRPPMLDRVSSSFLDDGRACIHLIGT